MNHSSKASPSPKSKNVEGEGSYSATRRYNAAVEKHAKSGNAEKLAQKAAEALDGPEGKELKKAEAAGKRGPRKH